MFDGVRMDETNNERKKKDSHPSASHHWVRNPICIRVCVSVSASQFVSQYAVMSLFATSADDQLARKHIEATTDRSSTDQPKHQLHSDNNKTGFVGSS